MKRFSYRVQCFESDAAWTDVEEQLNVLGADGWRMTGIMQEPGSSQINVFMMLEKEQFEFEQTPKVRKECEHGIWIDKCLVCKVM